MTLCDWPLVASKPVYDAGLFQVTRDRARSPRTGGERDFYVVHMVDWLLVVALTTQGELVLVRQYRHGSRRMSLECPGGLHEESNEAVQAGAARELAEETGYGGGEFIWLGALRPQPALLSNRLHIFLARGLHSIRSPNPDSGEDIEVELIEATKIGSRVACGDIDNAMTIAALAMANHAGYLAR